MERRKLCQRYLEVLFERGMLGNIHEYISVYECHLETNVTHQLPVFV